MESSVSSCFSLTRMELCSSVSSYFALTAKQRVRQDEIVKRRRFSGLKKLPVGFGFLGFIENDLATGSWWFVVGGIISVLIPIVILLDNWIDFFSDEEKEEEIVEAAGEVLTWWLLLISGIFVTVGSWCFVRAFSEPAPPALGDHCSHSSLFGICLSTDEVLASWLFLAGSLPSLPYAHILHQGTHAPCLHPRLDGCIRLGDLCNFFVWAVLQPCSSIQPWKRII